MNRGVLAAVAAFVASVPAQASEILNFDPGTYAFQMENVDYRVWTTGNFTVATKPTGDIANGYVSDVEVQVAYQVENKLIDLISFDVRGTGQLKLQNFDKGGVSIFDQPFVTFDLTGAWQTITFDTDPRGFLIRLTSDTRFDADNFVYGANFDPPPPGPVGAVPEPATWALMIAGFALVGFRARGAVRGEARLS